MSRLLKEDAAFIGKAYEKILSEAFPGGEEGRIAGYPKGAQAMPMGIDTGFDVSKIKIDPAKLGGILNKRTQELEYNFLTYFENPEYITDGKINPIILKFKDPAIRARLYEKFTKELFAHLKQVFSAYPGNIHPTKRQHHPPTVKYPYGYYEISDEIADWVLGWTFSATGKDGTKQSYNLVLKRGHAVWVADQVIKQLLNEYKATRYIPEPGEKERGSKGGNIEDLRRDAEQSGDITPDFD